MIVKFVDEGSSPVLLLVALLGPGQRPPHAVVDHHIVLVSVQQRWTCSHKKMCTVNVMSPVLEHAAYQE